MHTVANTEALRLGPREECGVVAVASLEFNAASLAAGAITALANRGHEMTGLALVTPDTMPVIKGFGTGEVVFPNDVYSLNLSYPSQLAIAHARYSTQGSGELSAGQPHSFEFSHNGLKHRLAHVHNGNLTNTKELAEYLSYNPGEYESDSELMGLAFAQTYETMLLIADGQKPELKDVVRQTLPLFEGAFTGAVMCDDEIVVFSDHHGLKPGMIGKLPDNQGFMIASEITALETANASFIRELGPGEIISVKLSRDNVEMTTEQWAEPEPAHCLLELLYFMKPRTSKGEEAQFGGIGVEDSRRRAGRALGSAETERIDICFGIPNSGRSAGEGYSVTSGIDNVPEALNANVVRRSFIEPSPERRAEIVRQKLRASRECLDGMKAAGVDDSIIRGTTLKEVNNILREASLSEFHLRIAMGMVISTCELGVDLGDSNDLLAVRLADKLGVDLSKTYYEIPEDDLRRVVNAMREELGVDTLAFLTPNQIREQVLGEKAGEFCMGCITGVYPNAKPQIITLGTKPSVSVK